MKSKVKAMADEPGKIDVTNEVEMIVAEGSFERERKGGFYEAYCSYHGPIGQDSLSIILQRKEEHEKKPGPHAVRYWWSDEP
ncbi:hypothetical protein [Nitratireductor pacificus]|uniref:Uncharacterized protein n=1 Tax=Nitratireductor pacificus pht-3B TaxID=391937 RepID=K2M7R1_9HYPH|nr:hypothetical protein [Nitratireductor pacificus]EKF17040.1 hypothetical protein NA2_19758 [Nitratireductor pacificus pht-3B]